MTKTRDPLSFSLAIWTICGRIGWEEAGRITNRAERTVQHWSESDNNGTPTLDQAIALDRAFIEAGGGYAPILESYARQLDVALTGNVASRAAMADAIAIASRETGEAIGFCIQAMQPGASLAMIDRAIAEIEEADDMYPRLIGGLKSLRHGNGAAQEAMGEYR